MTLGKTIRTLRERKHLKQSELAKRIGVAQSTLCDWESDRMHPRHDRLESIAAALDVRPARLLA